MANPWHIQSIYELQYFNCPSCIFKNHSKQEFVNHVYAIHPDSIEHLFNVKDNSLNDIVFPNLEIKDELILEEPFEIPPMSQKQEMKIENDSFGDSNAQSENQRNDDMIVNQSQNQNPQNSIETFEENHINNTFESEVIKKE